MISQVTTLILAGWKVKQIRSVKWTEHDKWDCFATNRIIPLEDVFNKPRCHQYHFNFGLLSFVIFRCLFWLELYTCLYACVRACVLGHSDRSLTRFEARVSARVLAIYVICGTRINRAVISPKTFDAINETQRAIGMTHLQVKESD